jgi:LysM repeat protein
MNWVKKNSYIKVLLGVLVAFIAYIYITDEKIEQYEQITIEHGDTLWSLADDYRGKMSTQDWVVFVQKENHLFDGLLQAGQTITIPVAKDSVYIANRTTEEDGKSIKVASDQK